MPAVEGVSSCLDESEIGSTGHSRHFQLATSSVLIRAELRQQAFRFPAAVALMVNQANFEQHAPWADGAHP